MNNQAQQQLPEIDLKGFYNQHREVISWVFELQKLPFGKSLILQSKSDQEYKFTFSFFDNDFNL